MSELVGKKIVDVRPMNKHEMRKESWHEPAIVIIFDDDSKLYPSCDAEGNGPGVLFMQDPKGACSAIVPTGQG